jgi:hypothetical protein
VGRTANYIATSNTEGTLFIDLIDAKKTRANLAREGVGYLTTK